jgi:hypothetical protein
MKAKVIKTPLTEIQALRDLFLAESPFQFIYNKCHGAGWADTYLFTINEMKVGYGSIRGKDRREDRDAVFEFYLLKPFRHLTDKIFSEFQKISRAKFIECQSNDTLLASVLFDRASIIHVEAILFEDSFQTKLKIPNTIFKQKENTDEGPSYVLEDDGNTVARGGYVWNYNFPFIDMYYEVEENYRQRGFGSLIAQELKKEAYRMNRIPAARCNVKNKASKATLLKAGMRVCGHLLTGRLG